MTDDDAGRGLDEYDLTAYGLFAGSVPLLYAFTFDGPLSVVMTMVATALVTVGLRRWFEVMVGTPRDRQRWRRR